MPGYGVEVMKYAPDSLTRSRSGPGNSRRFAAIACGVAVAATLAGCAAGPAHAPEATSAAASTASVARVQAIAPTTSSVTAEATVRITGTGLADVKTVDFGADAATVRKAANTKLVVTAPPAQNYQSSTVPIVLRDAKGDVVAKKKAAYSYAATSDVDKQLQYALAHWHSYNTAQYGDLNPVGGDCANFVSQTLIARGWSMNDTWYNHDAAGDWSPAWGYVPAMDEYFADNADALGLQQLSFDQRDKVALGDIAMFDWDGDGSLDHVQVVTDITHTKSGIAIKMASHNDDYAFRDLDTTITQQHPGATGHFWHLSS